MISTISELTATYPEVSINHETLMIRLPRAAFEALMAYESSTPTNPSDGRIYRTGKAVYLVRRDQPGSFDTWRYRVEFLDGDRSRASTQFISLDAHEILHALTTAAYAKAGFPAGTHVTAKVVRLNAVDNKPRGATIKMEVAGVPRADESTPGVVGVLSPWRKAIHELTYDVSLDHVDIERLQGMDEKESDWPPQVVTLARCIGNMLADREQAAREREAVIESLSGTVNAIRQEKSALTERLLKLIKIVEDLATREDIRAALEDTIDDAVDSWYPSRSGIEDLKEHDSAAYSSVLHPTIENAQRTPVMWAGVSKSTSPPVEHHFATGGRSILFLGGQEPGVLEFEVQAGSPVVPTRPFSEIKPKRRPETFLPPRKALLLVLTDPVTGTEEEHPVLVHQITSDGTAHVEHLDGTRTSEHLGHLVDIETKEAF